MEPPHRPPPPRIALVSGGLGLGGAVIFLLNFAGELVRRGVPVEVFSFEKDHPLAADFQAQNVPVLCLDERRQIFEDRLASVLRRLREFQPTVVLANLGAMSFEVLRYLPAGVFRAGIIHSDGAAQYDMVRHYVACMDLTAVVSQAMIQTAATYPEFVRARVAYLPLGVPMGRDEDLPQRDFNAPLRILYLGRLAREQKRVHLFPEILQRLCRSGIPFQWTMAGDGPELASLQASLKPVSSWQRVTFLGSVPYTAVPAVLREHDVFLLASDYEGLPLSLLEAMGQGLVPVVSNLKSGIPELVDASNGLLVPVHQTAGYAEAILHLHRHREELAAKSAAARARVKDHFSVAAMTDRWLAAFPPPAAPWGAWPQRWRLTAPLPAPNKYYFTPPVRVLRRVAAWLR